jgi:hypothetical protein
VDVATMDVSNELKELFEYQKYINIKKGIEKKKREKEKEKGK